MSEIEKRAILLAIEYLSKSANADRYSSARDDYLLVAVDILVMLLGEKDGSEVD